MEPRLNLLDKSDQNRNMLRIDEFQVRSHQMITRVDSTNQNGSGYSNFYMLGFFGDAGDGISRRLILHFLPIGSRINAPVVVEDQEGRLIDGTIFMTLDFLPVILDMVRNEKQLKAFLCKQDPSFNGIST
jgi:hypothetical protein